jgi:hypothetical protein
MDCQIHNRSLDQARTDLNCLCHRRIMPKRLRAHERVPSPRVFIRSLSPNGSPTPPPPSTPPLETLPHQVGHQPPPNPKLTTNINHPAPQRNEATNKRHRRPTQTQSLAREQRNPINVAHRLNLRRSQKETGLQSDRLVVVECCCSEHCDRSGRRAGCE